jgi:alkanesulfonate monooxygenase SsuD/methylene tetrahydromethanopterin reductase-like flavin-dependent oxidoreductase (luciferase family)
VAAEELGFDSGWVAQHHFGGLELVATKVAPALGWR